MSAVRAKREKWGTAALILIAGSWALAIPPCLADSPSNAMVSARPNPRANAPLDLSRVVSEPPPKRITLGKHFLTSNENHLHLFEPIVRGSGGVLLGVGTEQNFLLGGWARSEHIIVVDFDIWVIDLHVIYREMFLRAETPTDFLRLWRRSEAKKTAAWLEQRFEGDPNQDQLLKVFRDSRPIVARRFKELAQEMKRAKLSYFLDDAAQYSHLRRLAQEGKLSAYRADFRGQHTLPGIAHTLRTHARPLALLYLSNIEDYFEYDEWFRINMRALPSDPKSKVLRTHAHRWKGHVYFSYGVQPLEQFQEALRDPKVTEVEHVVGQYRFKRFKLYLLDGPPPQL